MPAFCRIALASLLLAAGCVQFERGEGTSASAPDDPADDPTTGASPPLVMCDPLAQDCPEGEACGLLDDQFLCVPVLTEGGAGDPCLTASECSPGLACCPGELLPECGDARCCASLCDVGDGPGAGCPAGTACAPVFVGPNVPAEYQDYGVCKLAD